MEAFKSALSTFIGCLLYPLIACYNVVEDAVHSYKTRFIYDRISRRYQNHDLEFESLIEAQTDLTDELDRRRSIGKYKHDNKLQQQQQQQHDKFKDSTNNRQEARIDIADDNRSLLDVDYTHQSASLMSSQQVQDLSFVSTSDDQQFDQQLGSNDDYESEELLLESERFMGDLGNWNSNNKYGQFDTSFGNSNPSIDFEEFINE
ncbi:hypothetical protein MP228_003070 [Amoeboaphelidium protococcarum]|nr:hypothetical protein MP228_003070 [Amoeboaphelidium protococcarum]